VLLSYCLNSSFQILVLLPRGSVPGKKSIRRRIDTGSRVHGKLEKGTLGRGPVRGRKDQDEEKGISALNAAIRKAVSQGFCGFVL